MNQLSCTPGTTVKPLTSTSSVSEVPRALEPNCHLRCGVATAAGILAAMPRGEASNHCRFSFVGLTSSVRHHSATLTAPTDRTPRPTGGWAARARTPAAS